MNLSFSLQASLRCARLISAFTITAGLLLPAAPAAAQIFRSGGSLPSLYPGSTMRGTDAAYDPANGVYLVVEAHGPVYGIFVNSAGAPVTAPFTIMDGGAGFGHFPRVKYSPHISNGVGGFGGFLVTWNHNVGTPNYVFGRLVSYPAPGRLLNGIIQIADGAEGGVWHETGPAMAYATTSQRFLVAWRTLAYGIRGRYVGVDGMPIGDPMQFENAGGARDPGLSWNPVTNEFGLVYTAFNDSGGFTGFRRVGVTGAISARTTFGFSAGTFATGIFLVIVATTDQVPVLLAVAVGSGVAQSMVLVTYITLRTALSPDALLGRIGSTARTISLGLQPIGLLVGGALIDLTSGATTIAAMGLVLANLSLVFVPVRALRRASLQPRTSG